MLQCSHLRHGMCKTQVPLPFGLRCRFSRHPACSADVLVAAAKPPCQFKGLDEPAGACQCCAASGCWHRWCNLHPRRCPLQRRRAVTSCSTVGSIRSQAGLVKQLKRGVKQRWTVQHGAGRVKQLGNADSTAVSVNRALRCAAAPRVHQPQGAPSGTSSDCDVAARSGAAAGARVGPGVNVVTSLLVHRPHMYNSCPLFSTGPPILLLLHSERYTNAVEHPVNVPHSVEETDSK